MRDNIAVLAACRSPIGKVPGLLNHVKEIDLLADVIKKTTMDLPSPSYAVIGSAFPIERDNLCRIAILHSGLPATIPALTVSKTCASSDEALSIACHQIWQSSVESALAGGSEKISNSSYTLHFMKRNVKNMIKQHLPKYEDIIHNIQENNMTYISEMLAHKYHITREMQDEYTIQSIHRAHKAKQMKWFDSEIIPIITSQGTLDKDEMLDLDHNRAMITNAPPMFVENGTLTQYNSAIMGDCACAVYLMDKKKAERQGLVPIGYIRDVWQLAVSENYIGLSMAYCIDAILKRNDLNMAEINLFEINESFASQALQIIRTCNLDINKVNVNGGNLALGYPIGATGLRMGMTLLYEMRRRNVRYGISVMCAGGNMANATLWENV